jgi:hypothetical protein
METDHENEQWLLEDSEQELLEEYEIQKEEEPLLIPANILFNNDSIELEIEPFDSEEKITVAKSARCVSVDTITPSPPGRRKKKSVTAKSEIIKFRCSIYEKKLLRIKAKRSGLTLSEYFRRVTLEQKIIARLTDEQIDIYKMLINYHNNFKSIGNMFKKRNPKLTEMVYGLANEIKGHLKNFKV